VSDNERDMKDSVETYRLKVLQYEALDEEIDGLIMQYGGQAENMPPEALARYRELARQRDDVQNEMRVLEQMLMPSDDGE
jgi:hypothetical protein